jgi:hypothetical protein
MSHFKASAYSRSAHPMLRRNPFSSGAYGYSASEGYPAIRLGATDAASGGAVSALVDLLRSAAYADKDVSGLPSYSDSNRIFAGLIDTEVRKFQKARGLDVDGIVGPSTWKALGYAGKVTTGSSTRSGGSSGGGKAPAGADVPPPPEESIMDKVWFWPVAILVPTAAVIGGILLWPSKKKTASVSMGAIPMASNPRRRRSKRGKR